MFISPLFVYYYTLFSGYKDKKSFCNRQIKAQLFLRGAKITNLLLSVTLQCGELLCNCNKPFS